MVWTRRNPDLNSMDWVVPRALFGNAADFQEAWLPDGRFWPDRGECFEATPDLFGLPCSELAIESRFEPVGLGCWKVDLTAIVVMALDLDLVNRSGLLILLLILVLGTVLGLILVMRVRSSVEFGLLEKPWAQQAEICSVERAIGLRL